VRAGARWLGPRAALFGRTDAAWWGLDGFEPGPVEFVTPRVRRGLDPRFALHTTVKWDPRDLLMHRGVRCTSVTRAVIDMAGQGESPRRLEAAIDSGVRMRLTSVPTLTARMSALSATRLPGLPLLRALLLDSGGESFLERRFLRIVRDARLPRPRTQVVHRTPGGPVSRVDFEFPDARLIVEVSGRLGHTSDADRQRDARRRNALQRHALVLEFTTADVLEDPTYVITTLRSHLTPASVSLRP
jgi:very-short-patch-repair endonuclease